MFARSQIHGFNSLYGWFIVLFLSVAQIWFLLIVAECFVKLLIHFFRTKASYQVVIIRCASSDTILGNNDCHMFLITISRNCVDSQRIRRKTIKPAWVHRKNASKIHFICYILVDPEWQRITATTTMPSRMYAKVDIWIWNNIARAMLCSGKNTKQGVGHIRAHLADFKLHRWQSSTLGT